MSQRLALRFVSGSLEGRTVPVEDGGLTVGRRPANDVVVEDASVSGAHAKLTLEGGDLWVADLGSTNGTRVGGRKVERMSLLPGDEIAFGSVRAQVVEQADAAPASAPEAPATGGVLFEDVDEISLEEPKIGLEDAQEAAPVPAMPTASAAVPAREMPAPAATPRPAARPAPAAAPAPTIDDDDGLIEADLEAFGRKQKGSKVVTIAIAAVVLVGAGVGGWLAFGGGAGGGDDADGGGPVAPVPTIAGNLLGADFSFEEPATRATWEDAGDAPATFGRGRGGAINGRSGLYAAFGRESGAELEDGAIDWAATHSAPVTVRVGQAVAAAATVEIEGDGWARAGLVLETADGPLGRGETLWGPVLTASGSVRAHAAIPADVIAARVVLAAGGDALVRLDDAALTLVDAAPGPGEVGELDLQLTGSPEDAGTLVLARLDQHTIVVRAARDASAPSPGHVLSVAADGEAHATLTLGGATLGDAGTRRLRLAVPPAPGETADRVAVVAGGSYRAFGSDFEVDGATQLLVGSGLRLVRFEFDQPVAVRGRRDENGAVLELELGSLARVGLQLAFGSERGAAATLASETKRAEKDGRLGDALAGWSRLLSEYGFQDDLVEQAQTAMGRLTTQGRAQLDDLTAAVDRASFFALPGVYDECAVRAITLRDRYTAESGVSNSVRDGALELLARIDTERAALVGTGAGQGGAFDRTATILDYLRRTGQDPLVERLSANTDG